jgi:adenylyltransferase/sulfurtransferase
MNWEEKIDFRGSDIANRQILYWGEENQKKLWNSKVLVIGNGNVRDYILAGLAGLDIRKICVISERLKEDRRCFLSPQINIPLKGVVETIKKINGQIRIEGFESFYSSCIHEYIKFNPDIIVECSDSYFSKSKAFEFAQDRKIPLVSTHCERYFGEIVANLDEKVFLKELENRKKGMSPYQGAIPAGFLAGVVLDEVRKKFFRMNKSEKGLEKKIVYNLNSLERTQEESNLPLKLKEIKNSRCLVAGAGGIGTYVSIALGLEGFKEIDILDFDSVEEHNLNRQVMFYEQIGTSKADTLSKRINRISFANTNPLNYKLDSSSRDILKKGHYDIIFGCFDNLRARYLLSEFAKEERINYIDGGVSPEEGSIFSYIPGRTPCVSCQKNIQKLEEEVRQSCNQQKNPSVIIPNMIVGSLMVGEAINLLKEKDLRGNSLIYEGNSLDKIYCEQIQEKLEGCDCL